jgi:cell division protein FtsB
VKELEKELANDDYREMITKFAQETQADLEQQIAQLKTENEMLIAEVTALKAR